jgi:muconate cycloisomerase
LKLASFEILVIEIPLRVAVKHALAEHRVARNVLVAAHDGEGHIGWGESCPRTYVTGENVVGARELLRSRILPDLVGTEADSFEAVTRRMQNALEGVKRDQQAAFCAAELAVLDLAGHVFGVSAGEVFGPVRRERARYSGVIAAGDQESLEHYAAIARDAGAGAVKVKVGADLDNNLRVLETARAVLGDEVELRIDANCAWDVAGAIAQLEAMAPFRLAGVEQPLPAGDLPGLRELTAAAIVPVVVDESLATLNDARRLVDRRACDIFNIRISKVGGLVNAARIQRCAQAAGLECQLGAQVGETGLLSAAGRHFATRVDDVRWCEGSYDGVLLETQITAPDITVGPGGWADAIAGPGLGVAPLDEALDACTVQRIAVG